MSIAEVRALLDQWLNRQWQKRGLWLWFTAPLSILFSFIVFMRRWLSTLPLARQSLEASRVRVPILIIGNIYIGGTGKTPVVIALVQQLKAMGWQPGVISRGYGTKIGDQAVTGHGHTDAREVGDEPALIARETDAPVSVHPNRSLASLKLLEKYPDVDVIVADDGLQHLRLARDVEIIVQDERGVGNGWTLPAGPLREPLSRLNLADAVITRITSKNMATLHREASGKQSALLAGGSLRAKTPRRVSVSLNITRFYRLIDRETKDIQTFLNDSQQNRVAAVAGIAAPSKFFESLREHGLRLTQTFPLADHFSYDTQPFSAIDADIIVITGKDAVKCESINDARIWVADVEMTFSDPEFLPWLDHQLNAARERLRRD